MTIFKMSAEEIISKLSSMHKCGSKDPEVLCGATIHEFDLDHEDAAQIPTMQPWLFTLCKERGDEWTKLC